MALYKVIGLCLSLLAVLLATQLDAYNRQSSTSSANDVVGDVPSTGRLLAVGDLHGDLQNANKVLQLLGVVDAAGNWVGGNATLVQTGDLVDRGPNSVGVLELFAKLKVQAAVAGGQVITLLGNHEAMNLQGQYQYVSREDLGRLGRAEAGEAAPQHDKGALQRAELTEGLVRWQALWEPGGSLGGAARKLPVAAIAGDGPCQTLFVHAGLTPEVLRAASNQLQQPDAERDSDPVSVLQSLNDQLQGALAGIGATARVEAQDRTLGQLLLGEHGPLWYRGYQQEAERRLCPQVARICASLGVHRIVAGHNVQRSGRIQTRCGGRLAQIDVGMSRAYLGGIAAWQCVEGVAAALYPGEAAVALPLAS